MISNLPLLFADGRPTCLEKITVSQLEKFVPFMIECSCGQSDPRKLTAPPWWPTGLQFSIPLVKPPGVESKWVLILKNLVQCCYTYHDCDFMLRFCADLSQLSTSELRYVNSWDGTTSLYNKVTGKLLVTFRNENLFYDKKKSSPKKTLLSRNNGEQGEQQAMVQPPLFDVYLCDNCDEEFSTLQEVQEHEKSCCREQRDLSPPSPPIVIGEQSKESFLKYFHLMNSKDKGTAKRTDRPLPKRGCRNSLRYAGIPISSPLGILVHKKTRVSHTTSTVQLERLERYCVAKPYCANVDNRAQGSGPWPVSWKPRKKNDDSEDWVHVYRKPRRQWRKRKPPVENALLIKNQRLLSQCQNLQVQLRKLTSHEIEFYTSACRDSRGASVNHSIEQSDYVSQLTGRGTTNNVNSLSQRASHGVIGNKCVKKRGIEVQSGVNKSTAGNAKASNKLQSGNDRIKREQLDLPLKRNVSSKISNRFSLSTQLLPQITCDYKELTKKQTEAVTCELTCIPVIDLVSSDEESEII